MTGTARNIEISNQFQFCSVFAVHPSLWRALVPPPVQWQLYCAGASSCHSAGQNISVNAAIPIFQITHISSSSREKCIETSHVWEYLQFREKYYNILFVSEDNDRKYVGKWQIVASLFSLRTKYVICHNMLGGNGQKISDWLQKKKIVFQL